MSVLTTLEGDFKKAVQVVEKWWGKEPNFATVAQTGISIAGVALEEIFTIEGNSSASATVGAIVSKAQAELAAATTLVTTVGPTPTVKSLLAGIVTDVSGLEAAAGIKDAKTIGVINLVVSTINNLVASFPAVAPPAA